MKNRLGGTSPLNPSPLPQEVAPAKVIPVRIVGGFVQNLPGRSRLFFQRQYFTSYPRPIQQGGFAPFPRTVTIAKIEAPPKQSFIIRKVEFAAYQHSGIGIEDLAEVPYGRSVGTLGFKALIDNRGMTDYNTNLLGSGVPITVSAIQAGVPNAPLAGQGLVKNGVGLLTPETVNDPFAAYARPGAPLEFSAVIFRPPSFDLRLFSVSFSGWLVEAKELESILDYLSR